MIEYVAAQVANQPILPVTIISVVSDAGGMLTALVAPITMGTIRVAVGVLTLIVGTFLWGTSEKTTKRYRRGVFCIGIGLILLILIPAINLIFWVLSFGG